MLRGAMQRLLHSDHKFVALIEQTLVPRAIASNIGARDERFPLQLAGLINLK